MIIDHISNLSFNDSLRLICHYHNYTSVKKTTKNDLVDRGYSEEQIKFLEGREDFINIETCGLRIKSRIDHVVYNQFDYVYDLYLGFKNGILPFPGSLSDQPSQVMQILSLLESLSIESNLKQMKKEQTIGKIKSNVYK